MASECELSMLAAKITELGGIAEQVLADAIEALTRGIPDQIRDQIGRSTKIHPLKRSVEDLAVSAIAISHPTGLDLREYVAAIRICTDLECIGKFSEGISRRALIISKEDQPAFARSGLRQMGELAASLLSSVLAAYVNRDAEAARSVWLKDAVLDDLEGSVCRDLLAFMVEDLRNISTCAHLLLCAKSLERIGDHATNIAEAVFNLATGQTLPLNRPKGASCGMARMSQP